MEINFSPTAYIVHLFIEHMFLDTLLQQVLQISKTHLDVFSFKENYRHFFTAIINGHVKVTLIFKHNKQSLHEFEFR